MTNKLSCSSNSRKAWSIPLTSPLQHALLLVVVVALHLHAFAQDTIPPQRYKAWLITPADPIPAPIIFQHTADSCIWIRRSWCMDGSGKSTYCPPICEPISNVSTLQFRDRRKLGRTMAITLPISLAIGALLGVGSAGSAPFLVPTFNPIPLAACAGLGLGLSFAIGNSRTNLRIDSRVSRYTRLRPTLDGFLK